MAACKGPLSNVKVLEFAGLAPVPLAGMILADFGASVIRVDKYGGSFAQDVLARGKKSITVDLKTRKGVDVVKKLSRKVDVLIEPFRPNVMEKLGLGPKEVMKENEKLIYARLTGFGQDGPMSQKAGHDINYLAISGLLSLIGRKGEKPIAPWNLIADFAGGSLTCVVGILMALFERSTSGKGQLVDCSMVEGASYLGTFLHRSRDMFIWKGERGTNLLDTGAPFYDTYQTKDGRYVSVGALEPQFYKNLVEGLGLQDEFPSNLDVSSWPEMRARFAQVFLSKTREEWVQVFESKDACFAPVLDLEEAAKNSHNVARGSFARGQVDGKSLSEPSPAPKLSRTPARDDLRDQPRSGEHTVEVLLQEGFKKSEINQLLKEGVIDQFSPSSSL